MTVPFLANDTQRDQEEFVLVSCPERQMLLPEQTTIPDTKICRKTSDEKVVRFWCCFALVALFLDAFLTIKFGDRDVDRS